MTDTRPTFPTLEELQKIAAQLAEYRVPGVMVDGEECYVVYVDDPDD